MTSALSEKWIVPGLEPEDIERLEAAFERDPSLRAEIELEVFEAWIPKLREQFVLAFCDRLRRGALPRRAYFGAVVDLARDVLRFPQG